MKKFKTIAAILATACALALGLCAFAACGGDDSGTTGGNDDGKQQTGGGTDDEKQSGGSGDEQQTGGNGSETNEAVVFEAEYTELDGMTADGGSITYSDDEVINSGSKSITQIYASSGYYVLLNVTSATLTFNITASEATTADLSIVVRNEGSTHIVNSTYLQVKVNGNTVSFVGSNATNGTQTSGTGVLATTYYTFDEISVGTIQLNQGNNTITFSVLMPNTSSDMLSLDFDCIKLTSSAELGWAEGYPITENDWDSHYSLF
ncbi:MAG: hypothetical protein LUD51_01280 [Clostridia bacterium]|nr:hypothetical protein [Clostridia bacterium]